jgi:hypothetical protein
MAIHRRSPGNSGQSFSLRNRACLTQTVPVGLTVIGNSRHISVLKLSVAAGLAAGLAATEPLEQAVESGLQVAITTRQLEQPRHPPVVAPQLLVLRLGPPMATALPRSLGN